MLKTRKSINKLIKIAREAGGIICFHDYNLSVDAAFKNHNKVLVLSEAFIPERDGYYGIKIMDEERLKKHMEVLNKGGKLGKTI